MKTRKDHILEHLYKGVYNELDSDQLFTTKEIAAALGMQRTHVSSLLNELVAEKKLEKQEGRPVTYKLTIFNDSNENSFFSKLVGYDGTISFQVNEAKSVLSYPLEKIDVLLYGKAGTGKSTLYKLIYEFSVQKKIIESELVEIDCFELVGLPFENKYLEDYIFSKINGAAPGLVVLMNFEVIPVSEADNLLNKIHEILKCAKCIATFSLPDEKFNYEAIYNKKFDFIIKMPSIKAYSFDERLNSISKFVNEQVRMINKKISIDPILMRCLMFYNPLYNFESLKKDISIGCMNAHYNQNKIYDNEIIKLFIKDFPIEIREGLSIYMEGWTGQTKEKSNSDHYIFDGQTYYINHFVSKTNPEYSLNLILDELLVNLHEQGATEEEIKNFLITDLIFYYQKYARQVSSTIKGDNQLIEIIGEEISLKVADLLKRAEMQLNRVYKKDTYYGLCIYINEIIQKRNNNSLNLALEAIASTTQKLSRSEYTIAEQFVKELENEYSIEIPKGNIALIAMILVDVTTKINKLTAKPQVILVMHGKGVANSISATIKELIQVNDVLSFDILLDKTPQQSLEELKQYVIKHDNGYGILVYYDMGSIKQMITAIIQETGISMRMIQLPLTLVVMESIKKAEVTESLDELYNGMIDSYSKYFPLLDKSYARLNSKYSVVTLCEKGHEEATQLKRYMEENMDLHDTEIIAIDTDNPEFLFKEVNRIRKSSQLLYIIGTYNPNLFSIPYLSFVKFLAIPKDMLGYLLLFTDVPMKEKSRSYKAIERYIKEKGKNELNNDEMKILKRIIGKRVNTFIKYIKDSVIEKELTLFLYFSLKNKENDMSTKVTPKQKKIIRGNKILYNLLIDMCEEIENELGIFTSDYDLANLINLVKN